MSSGEVVLRGARILVGDPRDKQIVQADLRIRDGVIAQIGADLDVGGADVADFSGCWIVPGFVDAHQHVWQAVLRGRLADTAHDEAASAVRALVAGPLAPADVFAGTYGGAVAMLDAGITCTFDHCDAVASAEHGRAGVHGLHEAGIRAVWGYGFDSAPPDDPGRWRPDAARETAALVDAYPLLSFGIAPAWDGDLHRFAAQLELAGELDAPVLTHTDTATAAGGRAGSEAWLDEGLLGGRHMHAFCSTTPARVLDEIARLGGSVVSAPDLELGGGLGFTRLREAHRAGAVTALGSGSQAAASADFFALMRLAMQSERMRHQQAVAEASGTSGLDRIAMRTEDVLHIATLGGARALGLDDVCGSIETGKAADLVVLRPSSPRLVPLVDPMVALVMHMSVADIDAVLVAGEFRKKDGVLTGDAAARSIDALDASHARLAEARAEEVFA
ncbi:amidohydrolase family protein [Actinomadura welshii]